MYKQTKFRKIYLYIIIGMVINMLAALVAPSTVSPAKATSTYEITSWGLNNHGQTSIPAGLTDVVAIDGGVQYSLALKSDGTVVGWGVDDYNQIDIPAGLSGITAIAAGQRAAMALKSDGTVVAWGWNGYGQTSVPAGLSDVVAISAGSFHDLALKSDGTIVGWGNNQYGQLNIPAGLTGVVAVFGGAHVSLALKSDGTVIGWGNNIWGTISIPDGLTGVVDIAPGAYHTLALKSDGTVVGWGQNDYGEITIPAGLSDVVDISAGAYHSLALKADGTVVAWGQNEFGQSTVPTGLAGVTAISAGDLHNLALVPSVISTNTAPTANPGGPYLGALNTFIALDGSGSSDADGDTLTYAWTFGDGATGTGSTPTHTYTAAGLYNACLTVNDGTVDSEAACTMAVVYDPSAGFVTGGGWILSPAGAYKADESLSGQATFGFVAKYQKGAVIPSGNTAFTFDVAGMAFASQSYEWLVVNQSGTNAQFKGSGTVNGLLDPNGNAYKFMLWAGDGSPDTFRMRIWYEDATGEHDVYDNGVAQAIGGGNIVVHTGK